MNERTNDCAAIFNTTYNYTFSYMSSWGWS